MVQGMEMMTLVDTGSQISTLSEGFFMEVGLQILPLRNVIGMCFLLREWGCFDTI